MECSALNRRGFLAVSGAAILGAGIQAEEAKGARIGFIGVGGRGTHLLKILLNVPGTSAQAICDINEANLNRGIGIVREAQGNTPEGYSKGPFDYRRMLERDDLDAVLIATPMALHAEMAIDSMRAGKHVGSEVPGATTMKDCRDLVKTKQSTGRRYMLLENYCYACDRMMIRNMVEQGVFGNPFYGECSYIHDCNSLRFNADGSLTWRGESMTTGYGNTYPTHSLGPVAKWMDINKSDRLVSLSSMTTKPEGLVRYIEKRFGAGSAQSQIKWTGGGMCVSLIKTAKDRLITVYYDVTSPRPMSLFYVIQGTKGVFDSRHGIHLDGVSPAEEWEKWQTYSDRYEHAYWKTRGDVAASSGHGGGDFFSISDFVQMVREDREPDIDVYDSATWSAVTPLSQESIRKGGREVEFPDFTV